MKQLKAIILVIFLICCVTATFAGLKLYGFYRTYQDGREEYDRLTDYTKKVKPELDTSNKKGKKPDNCPIRVDFESLKKINPDIVGWIYIPNSGINYPIVKGKDNSEYLHRTFYRKNSYVGAIFLDTFCRKDFSSFNSIIYGHNLKNGEMFGHLKKMYDVNYNQKADYRKNPKIWVITPDRALEYKIFAFREINTAKDKDVYTVEFPNLEKLKAYFERQVNMSQKKTWIRPSVNDRILTLSTCTSQTHDGRFIVQAVMQ